MDGFVDVKFEIPYRLVISNDNVKVKYEAVFTESGSDGAEMKFMRIVNVSDENGNEVFAHDWADVEEVVIAIDEAIKGGYNIVWDGSTRILFE